MTAPRPRKGLRFAHIWACPTGLKLLNGALAAQSQGTMDLLTSVFDSHVKTCVECNQALTELAEPD